MKLLKFEVDHLGLTLEAPCKCWGREHHSLQLPQLGALQDTADNDEDAGDDGGDERSNGDWPEVLGGASPRERNEHDSHNDHPLAQMQMKTCKEVITVTSAIIGDS